jgi:hypothetical protein
MPAERAVSCRTPCQLVDDGGTDRLAGRRSLPALRAAGAWLMGSWKQPAARRTNRWCTELVSSQSAALLQQPATGCGATSGRRAGVGGAGIAVVHTTAVPPPHEPLRQARPSCQALPSSQLACCCCWCSCRCEVAAVVGARIAVVARRRPPLLVQPPTFRWQLASHLLAPGLHSRRCRRRRRRRWEHAVRPTGVRGRVRVAGLVVAGLAGLLMPSPQRAARPLSFRASSYRGRCRRRAHHLGRQVLPSMARA